ncbi:unnamed protein product [Echinostoma caproni]|uniref:BZIP domain-containing protein n=1 Tax=Echinostoma caproni TaxID=27848 RepID=A0A183B275_9TREM|nr:unnamed protein product [Echinostoma caproni]
MEPTRSSEESVGGSVKRPTTLNLLLSPIESPFRTPFELTPQRTVIEKLIEAFKQSPQSLGGFFSSDDAEQLGNNFFQRLLEIKDSGCLTPTVRSAFPLSGTEENSLPDLDTPTLYNFICRQAAVQQQQQQQQQQQASVSTPIILCSPTRLSQSLTEALSKLGNGAGDQSITIDTSLGCDLNSVQNAIQNTLSITLPGTSKDLTNLQLCSGPHQFDLTNTSVSVTNPTNAPILSQPSGLKLEQMAAELNTALTTDPNQSLTDPLFWPLLIQTSIANDQSASQQFDTRNTVGQMSSPLDDHDATRPSSVTNGADTVGDFDRGSIAAAGNTLAFRSSSSPVSSNSSISQPHAPDSGSRDTRLDPTEQLRMRLERKRARNRDAARKCRERKIVLIKRLEKEAAHLTEENKALRHRVLRYLREVDRLKLFVVHHLQNECPAVGSKHA